MTDPRNAIRRKPSANRLARSYRGFVLSISALLLTVIIYVAYSGQRQFEQQQNVLVTRSVESAASQITLQLSELRRTVRLFARQRQELLEAVLANPDHTEQLDLLREQVSEHFPEHMAFAVANNLGEVVEQDIDGLVGDACQVDIQHFSITPQDIHTYLHPQPGAVHFDVMAHIGGLLNPKGVFFISFNPVMLSRLLAFNEVPHHRLLLLRTDINGLVEMRAEGARGELNENFRLSEAERARILATAPVRGTLWQVANLPDAGYQQMEWRGVWISAGAQTTAIILVALVTLSFIRRAERREQALRLENEQLAAFPVENPNPVMTFDREYQITYANPATLDQVKALGLSLPTELLPREFLESVRSCISSGKTNAGHRSEVGERIFEWEFHGIANCSICYAYGVDITDRVNAEMQSEQHLSELAHAGRLSTMGEMASGLAHELNQPLAAINSYLQGVLLRLQRGETEGLALAVGNAREQAQRAGMIIRRMRDMASKKQVVHEEIDLNNIVHAVLEMTNHSVRRHSIQFELQLQSDLPQGQGDSIQVEQVVLNLVKNAAEAVSSCPPERRKVIISTRSDAEILELQVQDSGPGLPGDMADQVFHPFYTTRDDGMGMGLSISKTIIENHG
ncbi:MAG: sensor histidine kinase, partial [Gammaproteobacteria bacterium]